MPFSVFCCGRFGKVARGASTQVIFVICALAGWNLDPKNMGGERSCLGTIAMIEMMRWTHFIFKGKKQLWAAIHLASRLKCSSVF